MQIQISCSSAFDSKGYRDIQTAVAHMRGMASFDQNQVPAPVKGDFGAKDFSDYDHMPTKRVEEETPKAMILNKRRGLSDASRIFSLMQSPAAKLPSFAQGGGNE